MTETLEFHPQMKIEKTGDGIRARLNKKLPADISQITTLLTHWISETEMKWDRDIDDTQPSRHARMFYEDRIFRYNTMFRYRRFRNEKQYRRELVLARVFIVGTELGKGYFGQLLMRLEKIAENIDAKLSVECASKELSSILLKKGYLREPRPDQQYVQLANALEGSWAWDSNDRAFQHKLVTVPTVLMEQIEKMSFHCSNEIDSVVQQELDEAFARISSRLDADVRPVNELKNEQFLSRMHRSHLRRMREASKQT